MLRNQAHRHSLSTMLRRSAQRNRDKPAIRCGDIEWSYQQLDELVDRLSGALKHRGIGKGDRVAILARNSHAFIAVRFAVARIAAVLVPINFMLLEDDVRYILEHSGARALFVDASTAKVGLAAAPQAIEAIYGIPGENSPVPEMTSVISWATLLSGEPQPCDEATEDDLAQIIYTSGTESRPKGAMLTHGAVLWQYQSCIIDCEWTRGTTALHALPLFHCAQLDAMMGPALSVGAFNIITDNPKPENLARLLGEHRVTSFFAPPTVWIALLRLPHFQRSELPLLVKAYYGASIMPKEILREIRERLPGLRLWNLYGQTEIAPVATVLFPEEHDDHIGSAGRATLHVSTRVVDEQLEDVAPGQIGEIVHRSPQLLLGYWRDEERSAQAFAGGWFHSGDLGTIDDQGYITIVDRMKDMIKTGGENVASREVEEVIYTHPAVLETAVIGLKDPKWIESVTAIVVRRDGISVTESEIVRHCAGQLAGFKVPKRIVFAETLPRNASGKILKRELRDILESEPSADG